MAITVTVQCVMCKARKEVGPGTDLPMCDKCFNPMVAVRAEASQATPERSET
jgi:hypothetical protein